VIKAEFKAPLLQSSVSWSYRNYYDMMFKKHLWLLSMLKTVFFTFLFQDSLMN